MNKYKVSGLPVTRGPRLVGILTNRDLRFERSLDQPVSDVMTQDLVTVPIGTTLDEAERILQRHRIEKLLVVDKDFNLKGLITVKDIQKKLEFPDQRKMSTAGCVWARRSVQRAIFSSAPRSWPAKKWMSWRSIRRTATRVA